LRRSWGDWEGQAGQSQEVDLLPAALTLQLVAGLGRDWEEQAGQSRGVDLQPAALRPQLVAGLGDSPLRQESLPWL